MCTKDVTKKIKVRGSYVFSILIFLSFTSGCVPTEAESVATAKEENTIVPTQATPSMMPTPSSMPVTATVEVPVEIPSGQYVMASDIVTKSWVLINGSTGVKYQIKNGLYKSISPTSSKVAYWEHNDSGELLSNARLVIHDRFHNEDTVISNTEECWPPLTWAPDETKIALRCGLYDIYILDLINNRAIKITESRSEPYVSYDFPIWSPDGKSIVFIKGRPGIISRTSPVWGISIVSSNCFEDETPCKITQGPFFFDLEIKGQLIPYWSPDSRYVVAFDQSGGRNVYLVDVFAEDERVLTSIEEGIVRMSWASDSQSIVVASNPPAGKILIISIETGEKHVIWEGEHSMGIAWSPDGDWIAGAHEGALYLYSPENGERKKLIDGDYIIEKWVEIP